jgi:hypothetical protein
MILVAKSLPLKPETLSFRPYRVGRGANGLPIVWSSLSQAWVVSKALYDKLCFRINISFGALAVEIFDSVPQS